MSFVRAICGSITHKKMSLSEGNIAEIEKEDIDYVLKEWERQGLIIIKDTYEEVINFKYKGLAVLAEESLASLNPAVTVDRQGKETVASVLPASFDFEKHAPITKEHNYIEEVKPVVEEKKEEKKPKTEEKPKEGTPTP